MAEPLSEQVLVGIKDGQVIFLTTKVSKKERLAAVSLDCDQVLTVDYDHEAVWLFRQKCVVSVNITNEESR